MTLKSLLDVLVNKHYCTLKIYIFPKSDMYLGSGEHIPESLMNGVVRYMDIRNRYIEIGLMAPNV